MSAPRTAPRPPKRRLPFWAVAATLALALPCLIGCPGELDDPDRFKSDAAAGGGSSTSGTGGSTSGTGGSTSASSSSTTSGTAGNGGAGGA